MSRFRRTARIARLGCLLALLAGCSSVNGPVDLASGLRVNAPRPDDVKVGADALASVNSSKETSCGDPTASLPASNDASGATLQEVRKYGKLRVGVDNNTYLFGFRDPKSGQLQGFDIDIAHDMAQAILGDPNKVEFKEIDSAQRVTALARNDVDMVVRTMSITCARLAKVSFSTTYFVSHQRLLVASDSLANGLADLGGKRVCATAGSTSLQTIASTPSHPIPVSVANWSDCLVMLQQHQVAGVSTDDTILAGMEAQDPNTKIVGPSLATENYGIAMRKDAPDLVKYVNGALDAVRKDGRWRSSYQKWIGSRLGPVPSAPAPHYKG
ncbi:MAG: glutamate ABC transporter substrate-binding protein [Sciscionella sp.]